MARNRKTVLKGFNYLQCDDFAAYLADMAAKGWHFKEWKAGLVFEKGEPEKTQYAVDVFIDGSEYDTRPDVHTQAFAEYCEAAGWKLVDAKQKFVIFRKIREDAVPILTPQERLENIAKEERKDILYRLMIGYVWVFLMLTRFFGHTFVYVIYSNQTLLLFAVWLALALSATIRFLHFLFWKRSWTKKAEDGEELYFGKAKNPSSFASGWHNRLSTGVILVFVTALFLTQQFATLCLILILAAVLIMMAFVIARLRPDAETNRIIQIIVAVVLIIVIMIVPAAIFPSEETVDVETVQIPLYYQDLDGTVGQLKTTEYHRSDSMFGSAVSCYQYYEVGHFRYYLYTSEHPWVIDKVWKEQVVGNYRTMEEDITAIWNAELAWQTGPGSYDIKFPNAVLMLGVPNDTVLSAEDIEIICSALLESR